MELTERWITDTWAALVVTADVVERSMVLFVVTGEHDLGKVETAYLPPNAHESDYDVLRRVGERRLDEFRGLHCAAIFQTVRDGPRGGFAAMLRHELRHAEQFHRYGPGLFELNGHLRAALGVGTRAGEAEMYESIPSEYDANRAAASYAHEHHADVLVELAADERFAPYARDDYDDRADDLIAATRRAVEEYVDMDALWNEKPVALDIAEQYGSALRYAGRDRSDHRITYTRGDRPGVVIV